MGNADGKGRVAVVTQDTVSGKENPRMGEKRHMFEEGG
jgi:hypothetical protein